MKNFVSFEKSYASLKDAKQSILTVPYWCITEAGGDTFRAARSANVRAINVSLEIHKEWLKKNFPRDTADAYHSDQFSFPAFFFFFFFYPELAEENKDALKDLLHSLKASNLTPAGIKKIPDISEFVKE